MTSINNPKQLALLLSEAAAESFNELNDELAQLATYALYLQRMDADFSVDHLLEGFVDSPGLVEIQRALSSIDMETVFASYKTAGKDELVYFYEDFLRIFDTSTARNRGVHYSPPAVVSYIVKVIASILDSHFNQSIDDAVLFDPCCGIGTFFRHIERGTSYHPRMIGTELMKVPYELAKCLLKQSELHHCDSLDLPPVNSDDRTLVILGNPPYSGHSSNAGKLDNLIADYRIGLNERNPKWLQDDYVKFIRMAQHRIEQAGSGIVAFITNHSYLFNPTFRIMRESLMRTFDDIYILDLHGNAKKGEKSSDENIFSIQMGVAITFLIKTSDKPECRVRYAELQGSRVEKLNQLAEQDFHTTPWSDVHLAQPFNLFIPGDSKLQDEYYSFPGITDLFKQSSVGFVTSRDAFAIDFDRGALIKRLAMLGDTSVSADTIRANYPVGDLNIEGVRQELIDDPNWQRNVVKVLYRPFDYRWTYYSRTLLERTRLPFMENMLKDNIALAIGRAGHATGSSEWDVVFCTDCPADLNLFRRGGAMLFPMYTYKETERLQNINSPDTDYKQLFYYIYALLHSRIYRKRYSQFLAIDYPRIPIKCDPSLFEQLAKLGARLVSLHLMKEEIPVELQPQEVSMQIGGYNLPRKYAEDRKHRVMSSQELNHLNRIANAIARTIEIQNEIDAAIAVSEPWH